MKTLGSVAILHVAERDADRVSSTRVVLTYRGVPLHERRLKKNGEDSSALSVSLGLSIMMMMMRGIIYGMCILADVCHLTVTRNSPTMEMVLLLLLCYGGGSARLLLALVAWILFFFWSRESTR